MGSVGRGPGIGRARHKEDDLRLRPCALLALACVAIEGVTALGYALLPTIAATHPLLATSLAPGFTSLTIAGPHFDLRVLLLITYVIRLAKLLLGLSMGRCVGAEARGPAPRLARWIHTNVPSWGGWLPVLLTPSLALAIWAGASASRRAGIMACIVGVSWTTTAWAFALFLWADELARAYGLIQSATGGALWVAFLIPFAAWLWRRVFRGH